jgi:hypothetical protein
MSVVFLAVVLQNLNEPLAVEYVSVGIRIQRDGAFDQSTIT